MSRSILTLAVAVIFSGCQMRVKPVIEAGVDECENCSMIIQNVDQGAVAIDQEEQLHTFCNPVCLIMKWNEYKETVPDPAWDNYLFSYKDEIPLKTAEAVIVHGDFQTAMGYGLLAFETREKAESFLNDSQGEIIDWNRLRVQYEHPDNHIEIFNLSTDDGSALEVARNSVVEVIWANSSKSDDTISLVGYDFEMAVSSEEINSARFIAEKPGEGFAFTNSGGNVLAMLRVTGEHTSEEAIYK